MANPFVHVELSTTDLGKAKSFYQSLFNWQLKDEDMGGGMSYTMISVGEGTGGGMMKHPVPGAPSAWLPYVLVDDIAAATAKAKSLGATVAREVTEVPNAGSFSIIIDPDRRASGALAAKEGVNPSLRRAPRKPWRPVAGSQQFDQVMPALSPPDELNLRSAKAIHR